MFWEHSLLAEKDSLSVVFVYADHWSTVRCWNIHTDNTLPPLPSTTAAHIPLILL